MDVAERSVRPGVDAWAPALSLVMGAATLLLWRRWSAGPDDALAAATALMTLLIASVLAAFFGAAVLVSGDEDRLGGVRRAMAIGGILCGAAGLAVFVAAFVDMAMAADYGT